MRRLTLFAWLVAVFVLASAAPALAAHCINQSKPDGAGNHTNVIVDLSVPGEETVTLEGKNGGFADVWLDFDGDGIGDLQVEDDVFLIGNHAQSGKVPPGQDLFGAGLAVLPGAVHNGSPDHGVGFPPGP